jgi:hypothetical protein
MKEMAVYHDSAFLEILRPKIQVLNSFQHPEKTENYLPGFPA